MANQEVKEAKANAKAEKAKAKAMRPWYKKKRIIIPLVILLFIIIAAMGSGDDTGVDTNQSSDETSTSQARFADRADIQDTDLEILPGESATIDGMKLTVDKFEYTKSPTEFEEAESGKTYLLATVTLENISDETQPYNVFNFRVQTAGGQVLDATFTLLESELGSGDLVPGGTTTGIVPFEVPVEDEKQYIIWKPNAFKSDRAIVQIQG